MIKDWQQLMAITGGKAVVIEKVYVPELDVHIEGQFNTPEIMTLSQDDQIFAARFIKSGGSIKEMEKQFGISYPTVKNRLKRIASALGGVDIEMEYRKPAMSVLDLLEKGEISVEEAMKELS